MKTSLRIVIVTALAVVVVGAVALKKGRPGTRFLRLPPVGPGRCRGVRPKKGSVLSIVNKAQKHARHTAGTSV